MFSPYNPKAREPEPEPEETEGEDFWRLREMGFTESQAREILYLQIPIYKVIALVEIRKCPTRLALEILR